jgi:hypothetical protein
MLELLTPLIQGQTLSPQDRLGIQTDVYALTHSDHINYVDYLQFLHQAYKHEDNLTVWTSILRQSTDLNSMFDYASMDNTKKLFQTYMGSFIKYLW